MKRIKTRAATIERKEQIISIATKLFYENGYDNTSTRGLADAADLSVAGVYYFFQDKEEVLFTILRQSIIDLNYVVSSSIRAEDDSEDNIRRLFRRLCEHSVTHKMELVILSREEGRLSAEQQRVIYDYRKDAYSTLKKELERLSESGKLRAGNVKAIAFNIFAITTWFSRWYDPNGALSVGELAESMADDLFFGIGGSAK